MLPALLNRSLIDEEVGLVLGDFEHPFFSRVGDLGVGSVEERFTWVGEGDEGGVVGEDFKATVKAWNVKGDGGAVVDDFRRGGKGEVVGRQRFWAQKVAPRCMASAFS